MRGLKRARAGPGAKENDRSLSNETGHPVSASSHSKQNGSTVAPCRTGSGALSLRGRTDRLRVMTFNIRRDRDDDADTANRWALRRALVLDAIAQRGPLVLGVQEAMPQQTEDLARALAGGGYLSVGVNCYGRPHRLSWRLLNGNPPPRSSYCACARPACMCGFLDSQEMTNPLFVDVRRARVLDAGALFFKYPPDRPFPSVARSKMCFQWGQVDPRLCNWVKVQLQPPLPARIVYVYNTHFPHNDYAKQQALDLISGHMAEQVHCLPQSLLPFSHTHSRFPLAHAPGTSTLTRAYAKTQTGHSRRPSLTRRQFAYSWAI